MLEDMLAAGMLTEEERQKAAIAHLEKVYGIRPVVYDFPCLGCHDARERERAAVVAYLRAYPYPTDPKTWADLIENGEHCSTSARPGGDDGG